MNVLRTGKIWDENQDRAKRSPPEKMIPNFHGSRTHPGKHSRKNRTHRMKRVGALANQPCCREHEPAADVEKDEGRYDRRIPTDSRAHLRLQRNVRGKGEVLGANETSTEHQTDHPDQHPGRDYVDKHANCAPT